MNTLTNALIIDSLDVICSLLFYSKSFEVLVSNRVHLYNFWPTVKVSLPNFPHILSTIIIVFLLCFFSHSTFLERIWMKLFVIAFHFFAKLQNKKIIINLMPVCYEL